MRGGVSERVVSEVSVKDKIDRMIKKWLLGREI